MQGNFHAKFQKGGGTLLANCKSDAKHAFGTLLAIARGVPGACLDNRTGHLI